MLSEFIIEGQWWFAHNPDNKFSGKLKFEPSDGLVLDLKGRIRDFPYFMHIRELLYLDIILGISSHGRFITLYKCREKRTNVNPELISFQESEFFINYAFIGIHFKEPNGIKFNKIILYLSHFKEWLNISGIDFDCLNKKKIIIKYEEPESIKLKINNKWELFFENTILCPHFREVRLVEMPLIRLESSEEILFDVVLKMIRYLRNFFSFGVHKPVFPINIIGYVKSDNPSLEDNEENNIVEMVYTYPFINKKVKNISPLEMLFSYEDKDVKANIELIMINWFNLVELIEPSLNLYFSCLYNPYNDLETEFIYIIQAIESFHRRIYGNNESRNGYDIEEIVSYVPEKYREWLKDKLAYANEPNLGKRLRRIVKDNLLVFEQFMVNNEERERFIFKVVKTRNYLTHFDKSLSAVAAQGEELMELSKKLKVIFETCLLKEIGFKLEEIKYKFHRIREYYWFFR